MWKRLTTVLFIPVALVCIACSDSTQATLENYEYEINHTRVPLDDATAQDAAFAKLDGISQKLVAIVDNTGESFTVRADALRLYASAKVKMSGIDFPILISELIYGNGQILDKLKTATANVKTEALAHMLQAANKIAEFTEPLSDKDKTTYRDIVKDLYFHRGFVHLLKSVFIGTKLAISDLTTDVADFATACKNKQKTEITDQLKFYVADANLARVIFNGADLAGLDADSAFVTAGTELIEIIGATSDTYKASLTAVAEVNFTTKGASYDIQLDPQGKGAALTNDATALNELCDAIADAGK